MALVVESTSSASASNSASVTVTKPTGVASGDLLLILSHNSATCSGFTSCYSGTGVEALYRIADASDVSASTYSVSHGSGSGSGIAAMMRISGWVSGNPIFGSATASGSQDSASPLVLSATGLNILRPSGSCVMIFLNQIGSDDIGAGGHWSAHGVTSGESNPSWTEIVDTTVALAGSTEDLCLGVAYATTTNTSAITEMTATGTTDTLGAADFFRVHLLVINAPQNGLGSNAFLAVTPTEFAPTPQVDTNGTATFHAVSPTEFSTSGESIIPTTWTTTVKS